MTEAQIVEVLNAITPLGILAVVVYLGYRLLHDLVTLVDNHLATLESLFREYLDIIRGQAR